MFTEILRIKPVLEPTTTARMERTLAQRFTKVTKTFGKALKAVVSGTALGIGLNILAKILNPIQELEEKMNELLGKGKNLAEQADRFGTSQGQLARLQTVGEKLGVDPAELQKLMEKYADAVETGKEELEKPLKDQSEATKLLSKDFLNDEDLAESFFKFIQTLKTLSPEDRVKAEKEVLGERLFGNKRRFADADFQRELRSTPTVEALEAASNKAAGTEDEVRINRVNREAQDFIRQSNTLGPGTVSAIAALEQNRSAKENKEFANFNQTANAAKGIEEAAAALKKPLDLLIVGISKLVTFTDKLSQSRWFRNVMGTK